MCLFSSPKAPADPVLPPETAAMKSPDNAAVQTSSQRRVTDQARARSATILTSGSGVTTTGATEKKTLLGA